MRKIIIILAAIVFIMAFNNHKCEHIYVAVEPTLTKVNQGFEMKPSVYPCISGIQDGKELICVKCFNRIRQKVDYGKSTLEQSLSNDRISTEWKLYTIKQETFDTIHIKK